MASGAAVCLALAGCSSPDGARTEVKKESPPARAASEQAPDVYRVNLDTTGLGDR